MTDESASKTHEIVVAAGAVLDKVPIYQDAIQPAAKQVGQVLGTTLGFANLLLRPVQTLGLAATGIMDKVDGLLREILQDHPNAELVEPKAYVVGNALWSLATAYEEAPLRDMYAKLLAASALKSMEDVVHPSFCEVIRQLSPNEARLYADLTSNLPILRGEIYFDEPERYKYHAYLVDWPNAPEIKAMIDFENLSRLGLIDIDFTVSLAADKAYANLETRYESVCRALEPTEIPVTRFGTTRGVVSRTGFGMSFRDVCVSTETWKW